MWVGLWVTQQTMAPCLGWEMKMWVYNLPVNAKGRKYSRSPLLYFYPKAPLCHISLFLRVSTLQCGAGGCLIELAEQLFIIMVGKQLINNIQEFIIPYVSCLDIGYFAENMMYYIKVSCSCLTASGLWDFIQTSLWEEVFWNSITKIIRISSTWIHE